MQYREKNMPIKFFSIVKKKQFFKHSCNNNDSIYENKVWYNIFDIYYNITDYLISHDKFVVFGLSCYFNRSSIFRSSITNLIYFSGICYK